MLRFAKRLAIGGAVLVVLGIVLLGGTVFFLGTKAGARFVLARATAAAANAGWKLTADEMSLDVFRRLHLKNVRLSRGEDLITLESLDVGYGFGLFPLAMNVEQATLVRPSVRMRVTQTDTPTGTEAAPAGQGLDTARQLLESPPAHLTVKKFLVTDLAFDYASKGPDTNRMAAKGTLGEIRGDLTAAPGRFVLHGALKDANVDSWGFASGFNSGDGTAKFAGAATILATKNASGWSQRVELRQTSFAARTMAGRYGEKNQPWSVASLEATADGAFSVMGPTALSPDRVAVETLEGQSHSVAKDVVVGPAKNPLFASPRITAVSTGKRTDKVSFETRGTVERAVITGVKGPVAMATTAVFEAPLDFKSVEMRADGSVDGAKMAEGGFRAVAGDPTKLKSWGTLILKAPLARRVSSLASITGSDGARGEFAADGDVKTAMTHVLDGPRWAKAPIDTKFKSTWTPAGRRPTALSAGKLETDGTLTRTDGTWKFASQLRSDRVVAGKTELKNPELQTTATYAANGTGSATFADVYEGASVATAKLTIESFDSVKGEGTLVVAPPLTKHLPTDVGRWTAHSSFAYRHQNGAYAVEAAGQIVQDAATPSPMGAVRFAAPAIWKMNGTSRVVDGALSGSFEGELPAIDIADIGRWGALRAQGSIESKGKVGREDVRVVATVRQDDLQFKSAAAPGFPALKGIQMDVRATLAGGSRFALEKLEASLGDKLLAFTGNAVGRVDRGSYQMTAKFSADVPKSFPVVSGQRLAGKVEVPLTINVGGGRDIDVDGDFILSNIQWSKADMAMSGIGGRVPLHYQLIREGKQIRFAYLTSQNPFERVDYERLRPLLARAEQVHVNEVRFADRRYGPIVGMFSMRQNLLFAHTFDASFGKNGSLGGEFFADLNPENLRIGLLSRVTAINLSEVLPTRSLVRVPSGTQTVSGRSGFVIDVKSGTADGRFDITEIGAAQLLTLINACDPTFENEQFNLARTALGLGYPTFVGAKLERGYMDLAIDLKVVGLSQHYDVRGVPLSTFLASAIADARTNSTKEKVQ